MVKGPLGTGSRARALRAGEERPAAPVAPEVAALARRLEELGALTDWPIPEVEAGLEPAENALRVALSLADALEWSERRYIESNVKLLSLREVASSLIALHDPEEATLAVGRYFVRAFGFEKFFLLFLDREEAALRGHWIEAAPGGPRSVAIEVPAGEGGPLLDAFLEGKSLLLEANEARGAAAALRVVDGDFEPEAGSLIALSLDASTDSSSRNPRKALDPDGTYCWCVPGLSCRHPASYQKLGVFPTCYRCEAFPHLGLFGTARGSGKAPLREEDLFSISSLAFTISAVLENTRLFHAVREAEQVREHILNSMPSGLVALDPDERILTWNRTAARVTGFAAPEVAGEKARVLFAGDSKVGPLLRRTLLEGKVATRVETTLLRKDGSAVPISISTSFLTDEEGRIRGAIGTFLDLTTIKEMEEKIRRLDRLAVLGRFTAGVAHEIRNPLAGIAAGVEYLSRGFEPGDPRHEHVGFILGEIARLNRIVGDLGQATRTRVVHLTPAPLAPVVERAVRSVEAIFATRGVTVRIDLPPDLPPVPLDADLIQQVFINLLKNAAEASPPGALVEVEARRPYARRGPLPGHAVSIAVRDRGPGFSTESRKRLFEPFFTEKTGGTGLGLYICHSIVEQHGGALRLESPPEGGATFVVELPVPPGTERRG